MSWLFILVIIFVLVGAGWWGLPLLAGLFGSKNATDKAGALVNITQLMQRFDISPAEVAQAIVDPPASAVEPSQRSGEIAKTLFSYLGAIFIVAGIGTYIGMYWTQMGSIMRIAVTLGVGYCLLIVLISALHENKHPKLIVPLALATAFMLTGGWFVFIDELFSKGNNWKWAVLSIFGLMAVHQGLLLRKYPQTVLVFSALFFVYGFFQTGLELLHVPSSLSAIALGASLLVVASALEKTAHTTLAEPGIFIACCWLYAGIFDRIALASSVNWAVLLTGMCVMSAAYGLQQSQRQPRLAGLGYLLGSAMAYTGLFDLVDQTTIELSYFAVTVSMLYACVVLKSRALLLTTVLAMLSYISYFSAQHFVDSLGWPITLMLMGVAFMGVSTLAIRVKKSI